MKLFYSPGACSMSPHIALIEAGLPFTMEKVDLKTKQTETGLDYRTINSKGSVPALQLDDGSVLTEGPAITQYIADLAPAKQLAPAAGTMPRYRLVEWLNYITSEMHKGFGALFNPKLSDEGRAAAQAALAPKLEWLNQQMAGKSYLLGEQFTIADGYLFTVLNWSGMVKVDLSKWQNLVAFHQRVAQRPATQAAMKAEGLIKPSAEH